MTAHILNELTFSPLVLGPQFFVKRGTYSKLV